MRLAHGLRAAAGFPRIGSFYQGGYFAGYISHNADGVATHGLIVAPAASGYNDKTLTQWKTSATASAGTQNEYDGAINTANMNDANHPAAQYCAGLTINGYDDWYLPARYELDIAYQNLKPTTQSNDTSSGVNPYSVPQRAANRTTSIPTITSALSFQVLNSEAFIAGFHYSSTEVVDDTSNAWRINFSNGAHSFGNGKNFALQVRAFRKFAV